MRAIGLLLATLVLSSCHRPQSIEHLALHRATRLVLITAATMSEPTATMQLFERKKGTRWQAVSQPEPAVVGSEGLAWWPTFSTYRHPGEPTKTEPDRRSPAGIFPLGPSFGFGDQPGVWKVTLETGKHFCVDDVSSPLYNQIVTLADVGENVSGERMWTAPDYSRGIFIGYPTDVQSHAGSCIFVHIWSGEGLGTGGCVGLPADRVETLQRFADGAPTAIAIISADALSRFDELPQERAVAHAD